LTTIQYFSEIRSHGGRPEGEGLRLSIRRRKLRMRYWINVKGHDERHPVKKVLENCWEYNYGNVNSFGWVANKEAQEMGITEIDVAPSWLYPMPKIDLLIHKEIHKNEPNLPFKIIVQQHINQKYNNMIKIFTDGSKDPITGRAAAAVYIPQHSVKISKRVTDHICFYNRIDSYIISFTMD